MRIAVLSDTTMATPTAGTHGLGLVTHRVAEGLLARGHDVCLFAKAGSRFGGALTTVQASAYEGEKALAREALKQHREWPFDAFLDNGHLHYLAHIIPGLPVANVYHDAYQASTRCMILLSEGQRAIMPADFENARIIHNALPIAEYDALYEDSDPAYALFVGAWGPIKQPVLAIEACARMGLPLVMAGQPVHGNPPMSQYSNVEYVGMVTGQRKAELFRHARVYLQLGIGESFGLTTVEAGLYGTPTVAWPYGGSLDIVRYGTSGVFVVMAGKDKVGNVCDAIERAMTIQREGCRLWAERYTNVDAQIDAYEAALGDCTRGNWW